MSLRALLGLLVLGCSSQGLDPASAAFGARTYEVYWVRVAGDCGALVPTKATFGALLDDCPQAWETCEDERSEVTCSARTTTQFCYHEDAQGFTGIAWTRFDGGCYGEYKVIGR